MRRGLLTFVFPPVSVNYMHCVHGWRKGSAEQRLSVAQFLTICGHELADPLCPVSAPTAQGFEIGSNICRLFLPTLPQIFLWGPVSGAVAANGHLGPWREEEIPHRPHPPLLPSPQPCGSCRRDRDPSTTRCLSLLQKPLGRCCSSDLAVPPPHSLLLPLHRCRKCHKRRGAILAAGPPVPFHG